MKTDDADTAEFDKDSELVEDYQLRNAIQNILTRFVYNTIKQSHIISNNVYES